MYDITIFYFNTKTGHKVNDDVLISRGKIREEIKRGHQQLYIVDLDPNGNIKKKWIKVPVKEGDVHRRAFWLSSRNIEKASEIVDEYLKEKWIEARDRLQRLEA